MTSRQLLILSLLMKYQETWMACTLAYFGKRKERICARLKMEKLNLLKKMLPHVSVETELDEILNPWRLSASYMY